jgi:hypothetical protein
MGETGFNNETPKAFYKYSEIIHEQPELHSIMASRILFSLIVLRITSGA